MPQFFLGKVTRAAHIPRPDDMDVKLPNLGEGADSGTVVNILVKEGAAIIKGQNILELETGKAVATIPASAGGVVTRIHVKEGQKVSVGTVLMSLDGAGAPIATAPKVAPAKAAPKVAAKPPAARAAAPPPAPEPEPADESEAVSAEELDAANDSVAASPALRLLARQLGIDLRKIRGSAPGGRVVADDIRDWISRLEVAARRASQPAAVAPAVPAKPAPASVDFSQWGSIYKRPMSVIRKVIAQRMTESIVNAPQVTQFDEADVSALDALRKQLAPAYEKKGVRLTVTSFILKAVVNTLKRHPILNSSLDELASEIVFKEYYHIGLAVDAEQGLMVPVLRDVDRKSLVDVSRDIQELSAKVRDQKIELRDMQGGTFTISNLGPIGGQHFTPIVNRPEVAILGLGKSRLKPVVVGGKIEPRLLLPICVSYDHRLVDGAAAGRFTVDLVKELERDWSADAAI